MEYKEFYNYYSFLKKNAFTDFKYEYKKSCYVCGELINFNEQLCNKCKKEYSMCQHCAQFVHVDMMKNQHCCQSCYSTRKKCCSCNEEIFYNNIKKFKTKYYCHRCYTSKIKMCNGCNNSFYISQMKVIVNSGYYCKECYDSKYFTCENCKLTFEKNRKSDIVDTCCKHCIPENILLRYGYKPTVYHFKKTRRNDNVFMGIELEITGARNNENLINVIQDYTNHKDFYFKFDASIVGYGFEIVSHPYTLDYHLQNAKWKDLYKTLNHYGINKTDNCGLHVHFNRDIFDQRSLSAIDCFVNMNFELMKKFGGRNFNQYCQAKKTSAQWGIDSEHCRYNAVNLTNDKTVELRFCESASNYEDFVNRIKFLHSIVNFVIKRKITANDIFDCRKKIEAKYESFAKNNYDFWF